MKIANSFIEMSSNHSLNKSYQKSESLNAWETQGSHMPSNLKKIAENFASNDTLSLSKEAKDFAKKKREALSEFTKTVVAPTETESTGSGLQLSEEEKGKIKLLEDFLSSLLGKKVVLFMPKEINSRNTEITMPSDSPVTSVQLEERQKSVGWGFRYDSNETLSEIETTSFKTTGTINTADGKNISIDVELNMSRSFYEENHISIQAGDAPIDPLVINFNGKAAELSATKFSFDIDSDGASEQISNLKDGSGFLAIDLNNDGSITNGTELFGPTSGNGFQDLAKYDSDHNNWIDENDSVFEKLRIWTKDSDGNDSLFALGEKGIGAVYLGNVNTEFSMKDRANSELAIIKESGIFLKENGQVGTVQQIDFVV